MINNQFGIIQTLHSIDPLFHKQETCRPLLGFSYFALETLNALNHYRCPAAEQAIEWFL